MTSDRIGAIEALLVETEAAHGAYEATELQGVYDAEWPRWYAAYAVEHGMAELAGRPLDPDELATALSSAWQEYDAAGEPRTEPWPTFVARRIAEGG